MRNREPGTWPSKGSVLLGRMVEEQYQSIAEAARELQLSVQQNDLKLAVHRVNLWHWIRAVHRPSAKAAHAIQLWLGIDPTDWEEPPDRA